MQPRRRRWIPAAVLGPVVAATALLLVVNGASLTPAPQSAAGAASNNAPTASDPDAAVQSWLAANASPGDLVLSDGAATANSWRDADYVVATAATRSLGGTTALAQAVANSTPVATFGQGANLIEIRRVTPEGAVVAAASADIQSARRAEYGGQTAQNPGIRMSAVNRTLLASGVIDSRIAFVLGSLASGGDVLVSDFPIIDGEQGQVVRQVAITTLGGEALAAGGALTSTGTTVIDALTGPFAPDAVTVTGTSVILRYSLTSDPFTD